VTDRGNRGPGRNGSPYAGETRSAEKDVGLVLAVSGLKEKEKENRGTLPYPEREGVAGHQVDEILQRALANPQKGLLLFTGEENPGGDLRIGR